LIRKFNILWHHLLFIPESICLPKNQRPTSKYIYCSLSAFFHKPQQFHDALRGVAIVIAFRGINSNKAQFHHLGHNSVTAISDLSESLLQRFRGDNRFRCYLKVMAVAELPLAQRKKISPL
jgi:hypothetical protein